MKRESALLPVFGIPLLLALCSVVGLVSALTGNGWRDAIAWIGLAVPVLAAGWAFGRRRA